MTLFPYTTLFRSVGRKKLHGVRLTNGADFMWEWVEMLPHEFNAPVYEQVTELRGKHSLNIFFLHSCWFTPLWQPTFMISYRGFYYFDCEDRFTSDGRKPPPLITSERPFESDWTPRSFQDLCLCIMNWIMGLKGLMYCLFWSYNWSSFEFRLSIRSNYGNACIKTLILYCQNVIMYIRMSFRCF